MNTIILQAFLVTTEVVVKRDKTLRGSLTYSNLCFNLQFKYMTSCMNITSILWQLQRIRDFSTKPYIQFIQDKHNGFSGIIVI